MKKSIIIFFNLILIINLSAQVNDSIQKTKPKKLPLWTLYVPGASYFYQGKVAQGAIFTTLELGGVYLGVKYEKNLKSNSTSPYYNYPLLIGIQAFQTEKLYNFRNKLELMKYHYPDFRYDDLSEKDLYLAPFKKENIFTPITGGMVLLAGVFLGIEKYNEKHSISEVEKMYFLNRYIDRNDALVIYGTTSLAISWGAGVGEEYICRNCLMPVMDYKFGQKKGLIFSSLFFGVAHFSNVLLADKPDYAAALLQVGEATIAGYFLGKDVQKRNYNIGPAVAAHMWYDAVLMIGSFLINPDDNFLGVNLKFGIN
ncbi:MAG: CPBP family intramembrane metalloprotease [Bacteroidales bacterium]|nr:CPBP family intramembrane metalloprotease [Bacteroidales bacterium]